MKKRLFCPINEPILVTSCNQKDWTNIALIKKRFIEEGVIPDPDGIIPPEVIKMWDDAKNRGIKYDEPQKVPRLTKSQLKALLYKKQIFIDVAENFIRSFQYILDSTNYIMSLCDETGIMLNRPANLEKCGWTSVNIWPGEIWSSEYVGCMAHNLALLYNKPTQIIGPVNYLTVLNDNISSAAPVYNEYGDIIGTVMLVQRKAENPKFMEHSLGWAIAIASAISSQLKLLRRDRRLKLMNSTLKATFAHIDDGYVSVDEAGYIVNINKKASQLFRLDDEKTKILLFSLFCNASALKQAMETCRPVIDHHAELISGGNIIMDIEPICSGRRPYAAGAIIRVKSANRETSAGIKTVSREAITFEKIIGNCHAMIKCKDIAKMAAEKPVNILLLGESGTGKELFAQAIHNCGCRGPLVDINCASIPSSLIESELFGYDKGAFTGAQQTGRKGKIEYANGGTLFLDEIGDMPLDLQPVFLRVLEEKYVTRIGGHTRIPVDFRIISATNKSLSKFADAGGFRHDLYFRLAVITIEIPPLRKRGDDILLLADYFIRRTCQNFELPYYTLSSEAERILLNYNWPGNVRQLANSILYAVTISRSRVISPDCLPEDITSAIGQISSGGKKPIKEMEKELIMKVWHSARNADDAAKKLGMSRSTMYRKLQEIKKSSMNEY